MDDPRLDAEPAFNPEEALAIVGGDKSLFVELAEAFRANYPRELSSIRDAISRRDAEALRRSSHHFKGTLGTLAAGPACQTAALLEEFGSCRYLGDAETTYARMEEEVRALDAALSDWA